MRLKEKMHFSEESKVQKEARVSYDSLTVKIKRNKQGYPCKEPDEEKGGVWGEKEGQLREVSHNPRSLSLTVTHCPSASRHSHQIQHPRRTSTAAQPHGSCFRMHHLSPWALCHWSYTAGSLLFFLWTSNCIASFFKYGSADVFHNYQ